MVPAVAGRAVSRCRAGAARRRSGSRPPISPAERLLLDFVGTLTKHAYRITDAQVQALRDAGWTDPQSRKPSTWALSSTCSLRLADAGHPPPAAMDEGRRARAVTDR